MVEACKSCTENLGGHAVSSLPVFLHPLHPQRARESSSSPPPPAKRLHSEQRAAARSGSAATADSRAAVPPAGAQVAAPGAASPTGVVPQSAPAPLRRQGCAGGKQPTRLQEICTGSTRSGRPAAADTSRAAGATPAAASPVSGAAPGRVAAAVELQKLLAAGPGAASTPTEGAMPSRKPAAAGATTAAPAAPGAAPTADPSTGAEPGEIVAASAAPPPPSGPPAAAVADAGHSAQATPAPGDGAYSSIWHAGSICFVCLAELPEGLVRPALDRCVLLQTSPTGKRAAVSAAFTAAGLLRRRRRRRC